MIYKNNLVDNIFTQYDQNLVIITNVAVYCRHNFVSIVTKQT